MTDTVYLIVEPMAIIARDLALNIQDFDPLAEVIVADTPDMASQILQDVSKVKMAFVHFDPNRFAATPLGEALKRNGTQIVFFGVAAEENGNDILVLQRPFTTQTTVAFLRRAQTPNCA